MTTAMSRSDTCHCGPGHVEWKWECHPVAGLGEPCITSAQCHNHQVRWRFMIMMMLAGTMHPLKLVPQCSQTPGCGSNSLKMSLNFPHSFLILPLMWSVAACVLIPCHCDIIPRATWSQSVVSAIPSATSAAACGASPPPWGRPGTRWGAGQSVWQKSDQKKEVFTCLKY